MADGIASKFPSVVRIVIALTCRFLLGEFPGVIRFFGILFFSRTKISLFLFNQYIEQQLIYKVAIMMENVRLLYYEQKITQLTSKETPRVVPHVDAC